MTYLILIIFLLLATVVLAAVGDRLGLPWPVLLTLLAAAAAFIPGIPMAELPAELLLPIFLPPLLWAMARRVSWSMIRSQFSTIIMLSVLLVFITITALSAVTLALLPSAGIAGALMLAAALAPPDPVAVDAVAEPAGIPRRITGALQSEGLFNDAASIVVFHVALVGVTQAEDLTFGAGLAAFAWSVIGALVFGLAVGRVAAWISNHIDSTTVRNAFSWVLPFAVYLGAEEIRASGVIALVIAAVEMHSRLRVGAEDRLSGGSFWETIEMLFTGVAFGLIGLNLRNAINEVGSLLWQAVLIGVVLSVVAIAVRAAWLWLVLLLNQKRGRTLTSPLRKQEVLLMTWSGMRGLVSLALVLSIPIDASRVLHYEATVIVLVFLVLTMVIPGLTLPWLVRRLSLTTNEDQILEKLRARALKAAVKHIHKEVEKRDLPEEIESEIRTWQRSEFEIRIDQVEDSSTAWRPQVREINVGALKAAQRELLKARHERGIHPAIVDELLKTIDRMVLAADH